MTPSPLGIDTTDQRLQAYQIVVDIYKSHMEQLRTVNLGVLGISGALCAYVGESVSTLRAAEGGASDPAIEVVWSLLLIPLISLAVGYGFLRASKYVDLERARIGRLRHELDLDDFPPTFEIVSDLFRGFGLVQWLVGAGVLVYFLLLREWGLPFNASVLAGYSVVVLALVIRARRPLFHGTTPGRG